MAAAEGGKERERQETDADESPRVEDDGKFRFTGQVIAAVVVAAVAGNILGARRFRKTITDQVSRHSQREAQAEQASRAAKKRAREAQEAARGGWGGGGGTSASFSGNPLRGRIPAGWEFDDGRDAAFAERRLNSQVLQHLKTLGVDNFVASREEVKEAYHGRAMHLHPDRSSDSVLGGGSKKHNEREFKRAAAAFAWLDHNYFSGHGRPR